MVARKRLNVTSHVHCLSCSLLTSLCFNPLNAELNPIRHLLALVGPRHIVHVSGIRVNKTIASLINKITQEQIQTHCSARSIY